MKYTGINIGPIVSTISMGRRPREIWAASYMFSFLMQCIVKELKIVEELKKETSDCRIISPATLETGNKTGVGLYPDRIFVEGEFDAGNIIDSALKNFEGLTGVNKEYINIMYTTIEAEAEAGDTESPIKRLNRLLDTTELCNRATDAECRESAINLITIGSCSPLHIHAFGEMEFHIPFLAEIATWRLSELEKEKEWTNLCNIFRQKENEKAVQEEDEFYQNLKELFKNNTYGKEEKFFSHYKYICIVQADGDNMGKIISNVSTDKVKEISDSLLSYGKAACKKIEDYGGLPIYAGGDDLLFIAPVKSVDKNIFDLLDDIDNLYRAEVDGKINDNLRPGGIHTCLSYGLSITYYKYPLYEAFNDARKLLFEKAKNIKEKNAISWQLRKHSGTGFVGELTKSIPTAGETIYSLFKKISKLIVEEKQISAIAHKLKTNEGLLEILLKKFRNDNNERALEDRLDNFYKKFMEEEGNKGYTTLTKELLCKMMTVADNETEITTILENMYGMLRTAKFIKGEGDNDE